MAIFVILVTEGSLRSDYLIKSDKNKALHGHCDIFNTTTTNIGKCLQLCLGNCLCKSFQLCHLNDEKTECHLCSSDKYLHPAAMKDNENCSTYNIDIQRKVNELAVEICRIRSRRQLPTHNSFYDLDEFAFV